MCVSIHYSFFSFWLTSLCIIGSNFIHLIRADSNVFFYGRVIFHGTYTPQLFIHPSVDGHLGGFRVLVLQWTLGSLSRVQLCDPMDCSLLAPPSMGFSRWEYWSGLPFPSPGDLPNPEIWTWVSHIVGRHLTVWATREVWTNIGIYVSFSVLASSGYTPGSGIPGSYGGFSPSFLMNLHTVFHSGCITLHCGSPFSTSVCFISKLLLIHVFRWLVPFTLPGPEGLSSLQLSQTGNRAS